MEGGQELCLVEYLVGELSDELAESVRAMSVAAASHGEI